eukprot:TRINITY_DN2291_c0_g1_i1.p4 TRINITY_DN2291_c0_g1~~TRINITY_DN2291_c0_g1_i1.p4  ORF type:complete len:51 (-),score=3.19 TRINITY_DN2291_c0_g1_i1:420-572(-)
MVRLNVSHPGIREYEIEYENVKYKFLTQVGPLEDVYAVRVLNQTNGFTFL